MREKVYTFLGCPEIAVCFLCASQNLKPWIHGHFFIGVLFLTTERLVAHNEYSEYATRLTQAHPTSQSTMVLIKRRSVPLTPLRLEKKSSSSSIVFGDGSDTALQSFNPISSPMALTPESATATQFSFDPKKKESKTPSWAGKMCMCVLAFSWIAAIFLTKGAWKAVGQMQYEQQTQTIQHEEALQDLEDAKQSRLASKQHVAHLQEARKVMQHEARTATVLHTAGEDLSQFTQHEVVSTWLDKRQESLQKKVDILHEQVSQENRAEAIKK